VKGTRPIYKPDSKFTRKQDSIKRLKFLREEEKIANPEIAEILNKEGFSTLSGRGKWSKAMVSRVYLENS
jgi:hypothetical protein